jgi:hypothetical protein
MTIPKADPKQRCSSGNIKCTKKGVGDKLKKKRRKETSASIHRVTRSTSKREK